MNRKIKLVLGAAAFIALIGGASLLYGSLKKNYTPPRSEAPISESSGTQGAESSGTIEPLKAKDFSVQDGAGNTVKLSDFEGKPVVVNFWASWCPPCKAEMPEFDKVWAELGDDVVFMMINATDGQRETQEKAAAYIAEQKFSFPVYYDTTQEAAYTYGISSLPTTMFIDAGGHFVSGVMGMIDEATLRKGIVSITAPQEAESAAIPTAAVQEENPSWCTIAPEYRKVSAEDAQALMGEFEGHTVLDVRTAEEFAEKRIDGAVLIPDTELAARAAKELPDTAAVIFVYCRSGRRSEAAAKALVELGYNHVYDFGGINDWPYATVSG